MVEIDHRGYSVKESDLWVPEKRKVRTGELPDIFGIDVRLHTQRELIALGILPEGSELQFQDTPIIHTYEIIDDDGRKTQVESDGQYFLDIVMGEDGILAYYLPPFSKTSEHEHEHPIMEQYKQIAGKSLAHIGNEIITLSTGVGPIEVPLNTEHQVSTEETPAFILIVMRKAGLVPRNQWHRPTRRLNRK